MSLSEIREIELFADHSDARLLVEIYCEPHRARASGQKIAEKLAHIFSERRSASRFSNSLQLNQMVPGRNAWPASAETSLVYETKLAHYRGERRRVFSDQPFSD